MVAESPVQAEQPLAAQGESLKTPYQEVSTPASESGPMSTPAGEPVVSGVDNTHDAQRPPQQPNGVVPNGAMAPMYGYPPPGAMYAVGPTPEMYQNNPNMRMMPPPGPYPFPGPQPGQPAHPMPPAVYGFPPMMPPPPPGAQPGQSNGASPSSPTATQMQPYPPYGMWYPAPPPPGMAMAPPPPGSVQPNGMPPMPMMGHYPPMYPPPPRPQGDAPPDGHQRQPSSQDQQQNGAPWPSGHSGLPPKEVARTIPCRYFPDCRFGPSCWFLHPGTEQPQPQSPPEQYANGGYAGGPLPPPVQYGPGGAWDPSGATSVPNGVTPVSPDASKNPHAAQMMGNVPGYNIMYAPYPYPGGYPAAMYPPPPQQGSGPASAAPQSPQPTSQPLSPQNGSQQLQQGTPSQTHSPAVPTPPSGVPAMYPPNGIPGGWYPAPPTVYPPPHAMQPQQPPQLQIATSPVNRHGQAPISPVSPHQGPNGVAQSPGHAPPVSPTSGNPVQSGHYPISPPYSAGPVHTRSPPQQPHPLSPQTHPTSPQGMYGVPPPTQPPVPVVPPHGRHSRRESMSSMSAMPMGAVLASLDGTGPMEDSRGPMDSGFNSARRGRGGHASRGSWGGNGFGSGRKPPCAFFPLGKCKNGDQCRFPHVLPDENSPASPISPRGGYSGSYGRMANGRRPTILGPIEDKMGDMTLKENEAGEAVEAGPRSAAPGGYQKPFNSSPKHRGGRPSISTPSTPGHRQTNHLQAQQPSQRVPSADDFPVLSASTPPVANGQSYGNAWGGPTAAQVLKGGISAKKPATSDMKDPKTDEEDSFRPAVANPVTVEGAA